MTVPLHYRSAGEWLALMEAGETSSRDLVELCLERIARHGGALGAVVALDAVSARAAADQADRARAHNAELGPLHGLPVTIKDTLEVAGFVCTSGAEKYRDYRPGRHAPAVRRLVEAGAIVLGKTNAPQFGGDIQTDNPLFGPTSTPWRIGHNAGGSSGGAAAAVAAGLVPLELGTDLAGSLRIPAHCCGIVAHRPSTGAVSALGQLAGQPGRRVPMDMLAAGPLARDPGDLALALEVLLAPGAAGRLGRPGRSAGPEALKLGLWLEAPESPPEPGVAEVLAAAVRRLEGAGVTTAPCLPVEDAGRIFELFLRLMYAAMSVEFPDSLLGRLAESAATLSAEDRGLPGAMALGATLSHRSWLGLQEERLALADQVARVFETHDALVCPVLHRSAWPHEATPVARRQVVLGGRAQPWMTQAFWIALPSLLGLPATVLPAGIDQVSGLPVGLQLIGPRHGDFRLLAIARQVHALLGGWRPPPLD